MRVVSLLPSATEILASLGGLPLLVGRSHGCDHPPTPALRSIPALTHQRAPAPTPPTATPIPAPIPAPTTAAATTSAAIDRAVQTALADPAGDLYTLDVDQLQALAPDVILTQDTCRVCSINARAVRDALPTLDPAPEIVSLNPTRVEDLFDDVLRVGAAVGRDRAAHETMVHLRDAYWTAIDYVNPYEDGPPVALLEWMDPLYVAGHWVPGLIDAAGGRDPFDLAGQPSRRIAPEELLEVMPERLIVAPCGMDLATIRRELSTLTESRWWKLLPAVQMNQVALVDGNQMFSRPGPRLIDAFRWLVAWLNDRPALVPPGFPVEEPAHLA